MAWSKEKALLFAQHKGHASLVWHLRAGSYCSYAISGITLSPMSTFVKLRVWRWLLEARMDGAMVSTSSFSRYWPTKGHTCCSTWAGQRPHGYQLLLSRRNATWCTVCINAIRVFYLSKLCRFNHIAKKTVCEMPRLPEAATEEWQRQLQLVESPQLSVICSGSLHKPQGILCSACAHF